VGTVALLINKKGQQITHPVPVEATVSWRASDGVAQAFSSAGKLLAELQYSRVEWIDLGGIRIVGMEQNGLTFRAQSWHYKP